MALNVDRIGHRYPPYRYEVAREKVREYAAVTGADPVPQDGDVVAPPTFAACFTVTQGSIWTSDPELGAHPALVHGAQEYEFHRPLRVGDVLLCTPWIVDVKARGRTDILTAQVDCVDELTGQPMVTSRSQIVFFSEAAVDAAV